MYGRFDADMCQTFINRVKDSLLLNKIVLSSGQEAEVIFFNRGSYAIPVVRTTDNEIIDLSERKDLAIKQIVTLAYSALASTCLFTLSRTNNQYLFFAGNNFPFVEVSIKE